MTTRLVKCFILFLMSSAAFGQPAQWISTGIGGGGSLYSPSFNPANDNEFYLACDMSDLFHTADFGLSYQNMPFMGNMQAAPGSFVSFTSTPSILYSLSYIQWHMMAVKSTDGGVTWNPLAGDPEPDEETYAVRCDFNNPNRVLVSYWNHVYFSTDGGSHFTLIHTAVSNDVGIIVAGVLFDGLNIYVGTNDGMLVSTTGGTSFTRTVPGGIPADQRIFSFAGARQGATTRFFCLTGDQDNVYLGVSGEDYWGFIRGVYSLDDGQASWVINDNLYPIVLKR